MPQFPQASFILSAWQPRQFPPDEGAEVAFAGRSNAGKSSALNALCQQNALARVSKTPGRTQQLVFFDFPPHDNRFLVDLPGYGYAKVPRDLKAHWQAFLAQYFRERTALKGLVVVMDIRHPLKEYDRQMIAFAVEHGMPAHVLLTKADKLGRGAAGNTLQAVRKELLALHGDKVSVQTFSGETNIGIDEARGVIARWMEIGPRTPVRAS
jgi:GTP-binding protein